MARYLLLIFCLVIIPQPSYAQTQVKAKESLTWFAWDLEPEFVTFGPLKGQGYADKFLKFFIENLPDYEHIIQYVNVPRWSKEVLKPQRCTAHLWGGFFPNKLLLSKPYSFTPPQVVIFHKRHQDRIGPAGTLLSLEALLEQTDLTLQMLPLNFSDNAEQSRYPVLHPYLAPYVGKPNLIEQQSLKNVINLRMLELDRADYTIGYPTTVTAQQRTSNLSDDYNTYPIKEHNLYKTVYVACNNDAFGRAVIEKINALLTKETLLKFLSYHEEWNNHDANFRHTTIDYFINDKVLENVIE